MSHAMDLQSALKRIQELELENQKLREQIIELHADKMQIENNWEEESEIYSEIHLENQFLKKRVNDLEQSYNTINDELKRIKNKYEVNDLESFMNLYGAIADRYDVKVIQEKYLETTGIKYSQTQLKRELELIGYQVKWNGAKNTHYVSKNVSGYLYIVQLNKNKGTEIYKIGRTFEMKQRLHTYKRQDGGATEIVCKSVSNQFNAEAKLLQLLNEAVDRNELKKNEYGAEYFEGPLELIKKIYNEVVAEYN